MRSSLALSFVASILAFVTGCDGCGKKDAPQSDAPAASAPSSAHAPADSGAPAPSAEGLPSTPTAAQPAAKATGSVAPPAPASASASASASAAASAAPTPSASSSSGPPGKSAYADEIPKPCTDGFGRLGAMTFTDLGGGRVRISAKNASAVCTRGAPTRYQCDWTVDGKPIAGQAAKLDSANKSVNGSVGQGKMWSCPPSSQR